MVRAYENWERLVEATLRREQLKLSGQRTPSEISLASLSASSSFNFASSFSRGSSFNFPGLLVGDSFTYHQILQATNYLSKSNLVKQGHSGDLFYGVLEYGIQVVVKKIDISSAKKESDLVSELEIFGKVSHSRLVPLLGHCLENMNEKFLVYKYMPHKDLSTSLFKKDVIDEYDLKSLDWLTRLKIAVGTAEGLCYLHDECVPPLVHRDIQASSILLDDNFEVRLGSLVEVRIVEAKSGSQNRIARFLRLPKAGQGTSVKSNATWADDVFCFGKVLLELVTGKLGFSAAKDSSMEDWMYNTLTYISLHDRERLVNVVDPSLIIDEDLLMEVWAMAVVAKSCLNPRPLNRPKMMHILKALENPLFMDTEENIDSGKFKTSNDPATPIRPRSVGLAPAKLIPYIGY